MRAYFQNWLKEIFVTTFKDVQDLILADQIKKLILPECKKHLFYEWENLNSLDIIAEKLDAYGNIRYVHGKRDPVIVNINKESFCQENYRKLNKSAYVSRKE